MARPIPLLELATTATFPLRPKSIKVSFKSYQHSAISLQQTDKKKNMTLIELRLTTE